MSHKFQKAILHFGADKTGSTSIQITLDNLRDELLNAGLIAYPTGQWHAQLGSYFSAEPENYIFNVMRGVQDRSKLLSEDAEYFQAFDHWVKQCPVCEAIVFSYEGFVDLDVTAIQRMYAYASTFAVQVQVVLYVRSPLSYAVSGMSQRVKSGLYSFKPEDPPVSPYRDFLTKILHVFDKQNVIVRDFSRERLFDQDVVADFIHLIDLSKPVNLSTLKSTRFNDALTVDGLYVGERLIDLYSSAGFSYAQGDFGSKYALQLAKIPGSKIKLNSEQIEIVKRVAHVHQRYIEDEFGVRFNEDDESFEGVGFTAADPALLDATAEIMFNLSTQHLMRKRADFVSPSFALLSAELDSTETALKQFVIKFSVSEAIEELELGIHIFDDMGRWAFGTNSTLLAQPVRNLQPGTHTLRYYVMADLPEGEYTAGFAFAERHGDAVKELAWFDRLLPFQITVDRFVASVGYSCLSTAVDCVPVSQTVIQKLVDGQGQIELGASLGSLMVDEMVRLPCTLLNESSQIWATVVGYPINLSYRWLDQTGQPLGIEGQRTPLPVEQIEPSTAVPMSIAIKAPSQPGLYQLQILPVQEQHCWFDTCGFTSATLQIQVNSDGRQLCYTGSDARLFHQVGMVDADAIIADGRAGFLTYGPYLSLPAGEYQLGVLGELIDEAGFGAYVDVAINKGSDVLLKMDLATSGQLLCTQSFLLNATCADLEIRVWVAEQTRLKIRELKLTSI
jgi:hypothetical protein